MTPLHGPAIVAALAVAMLITLPFRTVTPVLAQGLTDRGRRKDPREDSSPT